MSENPKQNAAVPAKLTDVRIVAVDIPFNLMVKIVMVLIGALACVAVFFAACWAAIILVAS